MVAQHYGKEPVQLTLYFPSGSTVVLKPKKKNEEVSKPLEPETS
jgi:hypothetical protein